MMNLILMKSSKICTDKRNILYGRKAGISLTIEEIAIRREIRQMLNEAGINKSVLSNMVKEVLCEEVHKVIN